MSIHKAAIAAIAACVFSTGAHAAVVEDLNGFNTNDIVTSLTFGAATATVTVNANPGGFDNARIFDSNNPTGNDTDLAGPFLRSSDLSAPKTDLGKVLIIEGPQNGSLTLPDDSRFGGTITFDFDRAVNIVDFDYIDTEARSNELLISASNGFSIGNGNGLVAGDGRFDSFSTFFGPNALSNVTSISFTLEGSGALDNFKVAPVPIPATGILLLGAMGGVAAFRKRARKAT